MDSAKNQLVDRLKSADNVLVTVSRNPSVDQLSALLGLTILLNKLDKHAAAVYSGDTPPAISFLQPEATIEKNTDSLRDFIIALDKSKADKLRYKVEDDVVRIFITPYKTSISQDDLDFSQGDFNVDVVVALGVREQEDLDEAITMHGRILHDATVASINVSPEHGGLGTINWQEPQASSLSELVTELAQALAEKELDSQIATALLTGIVAETDRFSNQKTSSHTMSASAALMAAGADQQLVAAKLDEESQATRHDIPRDDDQPRDRGDDGHDEPPKPNDGTLEIDHPKDEVSEDHHERSQDGHFDHPTEREQWQDAMPTGPMQQIGPALELPTPQTDDMLSGAGQALPLQDQYRAQNSFGVSAGPDYIKEPPAHGQLPTVGSWDDGVEPGSNPLAIQDPRYTPLISREDAPAGSPMPPPSSFAPGFNPGLAAEDVDGPQSFSLPEQSDQPPAEPGLQLPSEQHDAPPSPPMAEPAQPSPAPRRPEPIITGLTPPPPAWVPPFDDPLNNGSTPPETTGEHTLSELEAAVNSPHVQSDHPAGVTDARDEVSRALSQAAAYRPPEPINALNAQPLGSELHPSDPAAPVAAMPMASPIGYDAFQPTAPPLPSPANGQPDVSASPFPAIAPMPAPSVTATSVDPSQPLAVPMLDINGQPVSAGISAPGSTLIPNHSDDPATGNQSSVIDSTAPPPVPPPIPFQFNAPGSSS